MKKSFEIFKEICKINFKKSLEILNFIGEKFSSHKEIYKPWVYLINQKDL